MRIGDLLYDSQYSLDSVVPMFLGYLYNKINKEEAMIQEELFDYEENDYSAEIDLINGEQIHVCIFQEEDANDWLCIADKSDNLFDED